MLAEVLKAWPHVRGVLVDLPRTVARSEAVFAAAGVGERVSTSAQSFFDPLPAGADVYLLRGVLNDWPDEETVRILRRCAEAARPSGQVVVMGGVRADAAPRRLGVDMVLLGSRTNTVEEFRELARLAGLALIAVNERPGGGVAVVLRPIESGAEARE
jgi:hypothetical protein